MFKLSLQLMVSFDLGPCFDAFDVGVLMSGPMGPALGCWPDTRVDNRPQTPLSVGLIYLFHH